jgi:hypothetical protein
MIVSIMVCENIAMTTTATTILITVTVTIVMSRINVKAVNVIPHPTPRVDATMTVQVDITRQGAKKNANPLLVRVALVRHPRPMPFPLV